MWSIALRTILFGLLGLIVTPFVVLFLTLAIAYSVDSRCGTPGDSGGCEMGAASLAIVSSIPGALLGAGFGLWRGIRRRELAGGHSSTSRPPDGGASGGR
jgi:hypothetical protein